MTKISQKKLKEYLNYNPVSGKFIWLVALSDRVKVGSEAGYVRPDGYRIIKINKKRYRAHQLVFMYMKGYFPIQVDHLNHSQDDNRWLNLSASNYSNNGKNHPKTSRNKTGVVGVSLRKDGNFIARIYVNKKHVFLGSFKTLQEAKLCRKQANIDYGFNINHGT